MSLPSPTNPIAYAQFHLNGGWKTNSIISGAVLAVLAMLVYATGIEHGTFHPQAVVGWTIGMQVIQLLILLIYGSFRVEAAVRSDVSSRMIDSHRLMPSPAIGAILSYILVAPITAISLSSAIALTGLACSLIGGTDSGNYLIGSVLILAYSIFVWSIVARFAFDTRGGFLLGLLVGAVLVVSQGVLVMMLPGLAVLTCPVLGNPVFDFPGRPHLPMTEYSIAVGGQIAVAVICIVASARRFRSEDAVGFSPMLGLALVAVWIGLSIIGMRDGQQFTSGIFLRHLEGYSPAKFATTMAVSMLLAVMPIAASARQSARWIRRGPTPAMPRPPVNAFLVALSVTAFIFVLLALPDRGHRHAGDTTVINTLVFSGLSLIFYITATSCLFQWFYLAADKGVVLTVMWFVFTWVIPAIIAAILNATDEFPRLTSMILCVSPVGLLAQIWNGIYQGEVVGLTAQGVIMAIPLMLLILRRGRMRKVTRAGFEVVALA